MRATPSSAKRVKRLAVPQSGRGQERVKAILPLALESGIKAVARDVSESGIYFETDAELKAGSPIRFNIRLDNNGKPFKATCVGEVVRVERADGKLGVGARILEAKLEMGGV